MRIILKIKNRALPVKKLSITIYIINQQKIFYLPIIFYLGSRLNEIKIVSISQSKVSVPNIGTLSGNNCHSSPNKYFFKCKVSFQRELRSRALK